MLNGLAWLYHHEPVWYSRFIHAWMRISILSFLIPVLWVSPVRDIGMFLVLLGIAVNALVAYGIMQLGVAGNHTLTPKRH